MRIPTDGEDLTGKVCVCGTGRIGIVAGVSNFGSGVSWVGLGVDGLGTWSSRNPGVLFESVKDYHDVLIERFGGKLAKNG